jgi:hypothetical protein
MFLERTFVWLGMLTEDLSREMKYNNFLVSPEARQCLKFDTTRFANRTK